MNTQTQTKPDYYTPENEQPEHDEKFSPSGRYRLDIHYYKTRDGCWNYSRGRVYRVSDGNLIADIKRNYSTFQHSWVEKDGQEYLISGRSYMNQTIVNLDEAREIEVSNKDLMRMGTAFCWVAARLSPDGNTLLVDGCYWAGPFEYKFFDFTNPDRGWPEVPIISQEEYECHKGNLGDAGRVYIHSDEGREPVFNDDGSITAYASTSIYLPTGQREDEITMDELEEIDEAEYDNDDNWKHEVEVEYTLRRHGDAIVVENIWKSDYQQEQERRRAEYNAKDKAQKKEWQDESPLWAELQRCLQNDPDLVLNGLWWRSSSQHDRENGEKNIWFFYPSVKAQKENSKRAAYLLWGTIEGPVKAEIWVYGKASYETFDRSIDGLHKAIETIRRHLR